MKKIEIIPIAQKKLDRRSILEDWVLETMNRPDQVANGYGGRKVAHKKYEIEGKEFLLRVVYEETADSFVILTAYLTSQVARYWKEEKE